MLPFFIFIIDDFKNFNRIYIQLNVPRAEIAQYSFEIRFSLGIIKDLLPNELILVYPEIGDSHWLRLYMRRYIIVICI